MSASTFQIQGRPAVSALAGAAILSLLGMLVIVASSVFAWGAAGSTVGVVIAAVGVGLVLITQEAARKAGVIAVLDDDAFVVTGKNNRVALPWSDVRKVSMTGNRIVVRDAKNRELSIVAPPGAHPDELDALAAAMASRLDADRGYRSV